MRILTVCTGNICRSPSAAAAIRRAAKELGLGLEVDSAGTGSWNLGQPPTKEAIEAGARVGLEIGGRARKVTAVDFERFDIVLAMDRQNLRDLEALAPSIEARAKVRLFRTYDPLSEEDEVTDPYGGDSAVYDRTIEIIDRSARGLVASLSRA